MQRPERRSLTRKAGQRELARIMGGEQITEKLLESARELRAISKNSSACNENKN